MFSGKLRQLSCLLILGFAQIQAQSALSIQASVPTC